MFNFLLSVSPQGWCWIAFLAVIPLGLAIRQLAFALLKGSAFQGLRELIRSKMRGGAFGFEKLNELFTCQLCMTMQCSNWSIALPLVIIGYLAGVTVWFPDVIVGYFADAASWFTPAWHPILGWFVLLLGVFMYAMAVSGVALGFYNFFEYPAARYEQAKLDLDDAAREIRELRDLLSPDRAEEVRPSSVSVILSLDEFRRLMEYVNNECRGIGCGYSRRDCRFRSVAGWLREWAGTNAYRMKKTPILLGRCREHMADYFRDYSRYDRGIENEQAFRILYEKVVVGIA